MVSIHPFQALRYNPEATAALGDLIAPPYDIIGPDEQARLYQRSPHNIVRLILGEQRLGDTEDDNRYTRARRDFDAWRGGRVLVRDPRPAVYVVEHRFAGTGGVGRRLGFIALMELGDGAEGGVLRHEATLAAPKADRTRLLAAVPANLEPIFCVYPDPEASAQALLEAIIRGSPPDAEAMLQADPIRLWTVTAPAAIQQLAGALARAAVLIADGHHRFEVAWAHRARQRLLMSYFVSMAEPGLAVHPIHRIIGDTGPGASAAVRRLCRVEPAANLADLLEWLRPSEGVGRFGYARGQALHRVRVTEEVLSAWLRAPAPPSALASLDVSVLHGLLLPRLGGRAGSEPAVRYTADPAEAVREAAEGGSTAWLLRPMPLAQVYALAAQGYHLPPKSTYFYPKVPSGLTLYPFDEPAVH